MLFCREPVNVVLNSPVQRITRACVKWSDRQVDGCERSVMRVTKEDGTVVEADMVVMAVPLGVLQSGSIEFKDDTACAESALGYTGPAGCGPPDDLLPSFKQSAIDSTGFGNINKLFLHYDADACTPTCFGSWDPDESDVQTFGLARRGDYARGFFTRWMDLTSVYGHPVLVGFASGLGAGVMEPAPSSTILETAQETLIRIFGAFEEPITARTARTAWAADEYARGAVPHWKPGNTFTMWDDLARPVDNSLFFTGDYVVGCKDYPGYLDKEGRSCAEYDLDHLCTPVGANGVKLPAFTPIADFTVTSTGLSASDACCACGGGIQTSPASQGTTHGAMMAGRATALDLLEARDQVVLPMEYECNDDVGAILPGYTWKDTMAMGDRDCEYYRARPHACAAGVPIYAFEPGVEPEPTERGTDVSAQVRAACEVACGTCPERECNSQTDNTATHVGHDKFPCSKGSRCDDSVSGDRRNVSPGFRSCSALIWLLNGEWI